MRKLSFLVLLVLILSCSKEECYICALKTVTTTSGGPYASQPPQVSTATKIQCGMTEKEIEAYEKEMYSTSTVNISGISGTATTTCTCSKQP